MVSSLSCSSGAGLSPSAFSVARTAEARQPPYLIFAARLSMLAGKTMTYPGCAADVRHINGNVPEDISMSMFDLSGRVAVVTGGNGGIGLGIAQALALSGCNVAIWGRNADKNRAAAASMARGPGE